MSNDQVNPAGPLTVSVVTPAFALERWENLREAVASVLVQTVPVLEVIVVIDHNPALLGRARRELRGAVVIPNTRCCGASGARNSGVAVSRGEIAAFLDDDAVAAPTWLEALLAHFGDSRVLGAGSRIVPLWEGSRPGWLPREFDWTVGASYRGMPDEATPVRNVWSCGMAVSRRVFDAIGGFRDDFGKVGSRSRPEDTDLCLRAAAAQPGGIWIYEPAGVVAHLVPLGRATPRFFLRRCLLEGSGKAWLAALDGTSQSTSQERLYTRRVLPRGVARGLRDAVRGDVSGGLRGLAIAAGFGFAVAGFVAVRIAGNVRRACRPQPLKAPAAISRREAPAPDANDGFSPALMMDIELTQPLPAVGHDGRRRRAWALGRLHGEPVGSGLIPLGPAGLTPDQLGTLLWPGLREPVTERFAAAGLPEPAALAGQGLTADPAAWPFLLRRRRVLAAAPAISVVICTRDRPDQLAACLGHLARQEYPRFEIVVVDNAPAGDAVRRLVDARRPACRYVLEPRGGLSWARNAGIAAASGDIIAFLDDDEEPDAHWLAGLAGGFARGGDVGCVTGLILPARLDTQAQEWFERAGGHSKGRGFRPAVFSRYGPQSPLYPLPPFGAGGNMAFRREALGRIGGFDVAMGAGTPTCASEDTLAFTLVLLAGYRISYEPAALVRHNHHAETDGLGRQLRGYGVGLTAYYTALLRHRPGVFPALLRLLPAAAGYLRGADVTDTAWPEGLPPQFKRAQRWGMLTGPAVYLQSLRRQARVAAKARRTAPEARP